MEIIKVNDDGTIDAIVQTDTGPMAVHEMYPKSSFNVSDDELNPVVEFRALVVLGDAVKTHAANLIKDVLAKVKESNLQMAIPPEMLVRGFAEDLSPSFAEVIANSSLNRATRTYPHVAKPMDISKANDDATADVIAQADTRPMTAHGMNSGRSGSKYGLASWMRTLGLISPPPTEGFNTISDGVRTLVVDSVCLMVHDINGKLIVVSRKDNHSDLGMPGGKIEPGESAYYAIERECAEELGVDYLSADMQVLYVGHCGIHSTVCFVLRDSRNGCEIRDERIMEDFVNKEGALVTRVDSLKDIATPGQSSFAHFNLDVIAHMHYLVMLANATPLQEDQYAR